MSDNLNAYSAMSGVVFLWAISWPLGRIVATGGLEQTLYLLLFFALSGSYTIFIFIYENFR